MKEIKAYIRNTKAEEVVHALEEAGVPGITAIEVNALGAGIDPEKSKFSLKYAEKICLITKIEVVCKDVNAEMFMNIIRENAFSDHKGDGIIFLSDINDAIKIKTGLRGEDALNST